MGFNLSRPQYEYTERRYPSEYFRVCDPSDCFCGGPMHFRQRHVSVHRGPGGREMYRDPAELMDGLIGGGMYGQPAMMGGAYGMPAMGMGGFAMAPGIATVPTLGMNMTTTPYQGLGSNSGWPAEWKDPREWTTRDYDRLGEVMGEYLSRQRGRGVSSPLGQQMSPFGSLSLMDNPWESSGRRHHRSRPSHFELDQLRAQMFTYAQEAKEHMQATNDFLYGSEREQREERYKDRQRRMIEEILKGLTGGGRINDPNIFGQQGPPQPLPGAGFPHPMMGMPPAQMPGGHPMSGMPPMFPGGLDGMNAFAGMDGLPQRAGFGRAIRPARGLGFGDGFDQGGFGDDFGGRRGGGRRNRRGYDECDDDMMDMGDGRRFPEGPRRPRPGDEGGSGVAFDQNTRRAHEEPARRQDDDPAHARPSAWAAYEPHPRPEQSRYEASPPPFRPDTRQQATWPSQSYDGPGVAPHGGSFTQYPPRYTQPQGDRAQINAARPHVSFQDQSGTAERPDERNDHV